ncbi:MAG: flagellar basal-body rod protein FlgF [Acidobacteriaceae bacterium]|nr:flagellar basal-body rod protein FlgF [Acidobacteriaceae bacterium]
MDPLTSAAASGMRTSLESLDLLANNLANTQTNGYKVDREFYDMYTSADALAGGENDPTQMPDIIKNWTDFSQGSLQQTSNPLDFAVGGEGFFAVNGPGGNTLYTRNGSFRLSPTGQLTTQDGYAVRDVNGNPVQLDPTQPITVDTTGAITQGGQTVAQLQVASFADLSQLSKQGTTYFRFNGQAADIKRAPGEVEQGKVEGSNVTPAESAVRLVTVMRQFEMLQKAISIGTDMNHQAIEEVARSGQ